MSHALQVAGQTLRKHEVRSTLVQCVGTAGALNCGLQIQAPKGPGAPDVLHMCYVPWVCGYFHFTEINILEKIGKRLPMWAV